MISSQPNRLNLYKLRENSSATQCDKIERYTTEITNQLVENDQMSYQ